RCCGSVLHLVQALLKTESKPPALWLVTQGSQTVIRDEAVPAVAQSSLWGMARVIGLEHPELNCVRVDLDPQMPAAVQAKRLATELISQPRSIRLEEEQLAWRNGQRYIPRLVRYNPEQLEDTFVSIRDDKTYLITGGLGGLGLTVASWLVDQGARHLLLLGRSRPTAEVESPLEKMRQTGADVITVQADVSDQAQVARILAGLDERYPLRGVIHAAGVLDDGALLQQSWQRFETVLAPKVSGAWNLHRLTTDMPLDFFVLFSSAAGLWGNRGQANHAAANAFLDGLAHYRRAHDLPALSIDWGAWSEVGAAAGMSQRDRLRLKTRGQGLISPRQGIEIFTHLLAQDTAQVGVIPVDWPQFLNSFEVVPSFLATFSTSALKTSRLPSEQTVNSGGLPEQLMQFASAKRKELLNHYLAEKLTQILENKSFDSINTRVSLTELGMDSLMSIELKNMVSRDLNISLSITSFIDSSVEQLATLLSDQFTRTALLQPESSAADADDRSDDLEEEFVI
ncbi:MAG: SDR family NAD(P)-dependent oxidoreductase, partial [Anaerolineae bacterium]|nr:SDR family NAD(P)-dependent oxidoreductase [Anaerolineae bacterium]